MRAVSKKRAKAKREEKKLDRQLCDRVDGNWQQDDAGQWYCQGGACEHCGRAPDWRGLQKHEYITRRSQGGTPSLENSQLWCAFCHFGADGHRTDLPKQ